MTTETKSKKSLLIEAVRETTAQFTSHRLAILNIHRELEEIQAEDDYVDGLRDVVAAHGTGGITVATLHLIFADAAQLAKARKKLLKDGDITEEKSGMTLLLKIADKSAAVDTAA